MKKLILFALSVALLLSGCTSTDGTGNFKLFLTDQPIENADEIWVTISEINVHKEELGFFTLSQGEQKFDLLTLLNTEVLVLSKTLEAGTYTQIRLVVSEGAIVIDDVTYPMTVPSSEVKIPLVFIVMDEDNIEVVLDFEADESVDVVYTAEGNEYILNPVIRVKSITH